MNALEKVAEAVYNMDEDRIEILIQEAIDSGISTVDIYEKGLSAGMVQVTKLYEENKYYIPEVIVCADTLNKGVQFLKGKGIQKESQGPKIILGVVEGDLHEIGKNIVKIMMEASDFRVVDMGLNVKAEDIVERAIEEKADIIALSTMMTTTMEVMKETVDLMKNKNIKDSEKPKIIIGGGCISQKYADKIGADGYSKNAMEAVQLVRSLMEEK
ncbi:MAG: cobalamin-binding protein [Gallicola sp.]|nr:cobalamin-binding protein [Gallicola sp.]